MRGEKEERYGGVRVYVGVGGWGVARGRSFEDLKIGPARIALWDSK